MVRPQADFTQDATDRSEIIFDMPRKLDKKEDPIILRQGVMMRDKSGKCIEGPPALGSLSMSRIEYQRVSIRNDRKDSSPRIGIKQIKTTSFNLDNESKVNTPEKPSGLSQFKDR